MDDKERRKTPSLRVQTAPFGRYWYIYIPFHMSQYIHIDIPSLLQLFFKVQAPRYLFDLFEGTIWVVSPQQNHLETCFSRERPTPRKSKEHMTCLKNHMCLVQFKQNQPEVRSVDTCLVVLYQNELCLASLINLFLNQKHCQ